MNHLIIVVGLRWALVESEPGRPSHRRRACCKPRMFEKSADALLLQYSCHELHFSTAGLALRHVDPEHTGKKFGPAKAHLASLHHEALFDAGVLHYDGMPITASFLVAAIRSGLEKAAGAIGRGTK
jgi:hypothetical protein